MMCRKELTRKGVLQEITLLVVIGIILSYFFFMTFTYGYNAAFFPRLVSGACLVILIYDIIGKLVEVGRLKQAGEQRGADPEQKMVVYPWINNLLVALCYVFLLWLAGFVIATVAYVLFGSLLIDRQSPAKVAIVAAVFTAIMYFLFTFMMIPFPSGIIFD